MVEIEVMTTTQCSCCGEQWVVLRVSSPTGMSESQMSPGEARHQAARITERVEEARRGRSNRATLDKTPAQTTHGGRTGMPGLAAPLDVLEDLAAKLTGAAALLDGSGAMA